MFCPKCGVQIAETTKYCKSCGMSLAPVMNFVASGGNSPLGASSWTSAFSDFSPAQKMWLIIMALIFSPILLGALPFFVPIAIVWMILQHNKQKHYPGAQAALPGYYQQPQIQSPPTNPLNESQQASRPAPSQTSALIPGAAPGSVIEDDTRRLQN